MILTDSFNEYNVQPPDGRFSQCITGQQVWGEEKKEEKKKKEKRKERCIRGTQRGKNGKKKKSPEKHVPSKFLEYANLTGQALREA
ncbi:MAG: hypothetical protein WA705_29815 [Candidatus Ozemobacteraceae bacterium]